MSAEVAEMIVKRYESGEMDEMEAEYAHQDRRNINALTEDQVCDLEEAVGVMRSLLRGLTQKVRKLTIYSDACS